MLRKPPSVVMQFQGFILRPFYRNQSLRAALEVLAGERSHSYTSDNRAPLSRKVVLSHRMPTLGGARGAVRQEGDTRLPARPARPAVAISGVTAVTAGCLSQPEATLCPRTCVPTSVEPQKQHQSGGSKPEPPTAGPWLAGSQAQGLLRPGPP